MSSPKPRRRVPPPALIAGATKVATAATASTPERRARRAVTEEAEAPLAAAPESTGSQMNPFLPLIFLALPIVLALIANFFATPGQ